MSVQRIISPLPMPPDDIAEIQILITYGRHPDIGSMKVLRYGIHIHIKSDLWYFEASKTAAEVLEMKAEQFENKFDVTYKSMHYMPAWTCNGTCVRCLVRKGYLKYVNHNKTEVTVTEKGLRYGKELLLKHGNKYKEDKS